MIAVCEFNSRPCLPEIIPLFIIDEVAAVLLKRRARPEFVLVWIVPLFTKFSIATPTTETTYPSLEKVAPIVTPVLTVKLVLGAVALTVASVELMVALITWALLILVIKKKVTRIKIKKF